MILEVFGEVLLPLVLLASLGAAVGRTVGVAVAPLSNLAYSLFTPALVFETLVNAEIEAELVPQAIGVVAAGFLASAALGLGWAALRTHSPPEVSATALSAAIANLGNMGLPVAGLAFGRAGLAVAVVAFLTGSVLSNSLGIVIASLSELRLRTALLAPLRVPALWAVVPALLVRGLDLRLGAWLHETTSLLSAAAIPVMLVVLGLQASAARLTRQDLAAVAAPVTLRLVFGPLIALVATTAFGMSGTPRATLIVLGGMPVAVVATVIATRHAAAPRLVARAVMVSTVTCLLTLTLLIAMVQ